MRALFVTMAVAIVLAWTGYHTRVSYPLIGTTCLTLAGLLTLLGIVVFYGFN